MIVTAVAIGVLVVELTALLRAGLGGDNAPSRMRLGVVVLESLVTVAVARAIVGWDQWTQWVWVLAVAVFAAGLALAVIRWRELPAVQEGTAAWRTGASGAYAALLVAITGGVVVAFV